MTDQMSEHDQKMIALAESSGARIRAGNAVTGESSEFVAGSESDPARGAAPAAPATATADVKQGDKPVRPEWCPEKFWNAETGQVNQEALAKSYVEIESSRTKPEVAKPGEAVATETQTPEQLAAIKAAEDAAKAAAAPTAALSTAMEKAAAEFKATGAISEDSFKALEANGLGREYVSNYANGLKAQAEIVSMKVYGEAGGEDNYNAMGAWARANWSAAQIEAHNRAVTSGNLEATLGAIRTMKSAYDSSNGKAPTTRVEPQGGSAAAAANDMYRSAAEVHKDMSDDRYRKGDPAFHRMVDRKLEAAMAAGVNLGF